MRLSVGWVIKVLMAILGSTPIALSPSPQLHQFSEYSFEVAHQRVRLFEWDYGVRYGCPPGTYVGVVLQKALNAHLPSLWTYNIANVLDGLPPGGDCADLEGLLGGSWTARIAGVALPSNREAQFVVTTLLCGGSCAGYWAEAFRFDGRRVTSELKESLGLGGVKFEFPVLTLYRNNGYKECPSHWTRFTFRWVNAAYTLLDTVTYASPVCSYDPATKWPPDP